MRTTQPTKTLINYWEAKLKEIIYWVTTSEEVMIVDTIKKLNELKEIEDKNIFDKNLLSNSAISSHICHPEMP
jgi:hypothetical protein